MLGKKKSIVAENNSKGREEKSHFKISLYNSIRKIILRLIQIMHCIIYFFEKEKQNTKTKTIRTN